MQRERTMTSRFEIPRPPRQYLSPYHVRKYSKKRRARLREAKLCINGPKHGAATRGVRCESCYQTHKRSA